MNRTATTRRIGSTVALVALTIGLGAATAQTADAAPARHGAGITPSRYVLSVETPGLKAPAPRPAPKSAPPVVRPLA